MKIIFMAFIVSLSYLVDAKETTIVNTPEGISITFEKLTSEEYSNESKDFMFNEKNVRIIGENRYDLIYYALSPLVEVTFAERGKRVRTKHLEEHLKFDFNFGYEFPISIISRNAKKLEKEEFFKIINREFLEFINYQERTIWADWVSLKVDLALVYEAGLDMPRVPSYNYGPYTIDNCIIYKKGTKLDYFFEDLGMFFHFKIEHHNVLNYVIGNKQMKICLDLSWIEMCEYLKEEFGLIMDSTNKPKSKLIVISSKRKK